MTYFPLGAIEVTPFTVANDRDESNLGAGAATGPDLAAARLSASFLHSSGSRSSRAKVASAIAPPEVFVNASSSFRSSAIPQTHYFTTTTFI